MKDEERISQELRIELSDSGLLTHRRCVIRFSPFILLPSSFSLPAALKLQVKEVEHRAAEVVAIVLGHLLRHHLI